MNKEMKQENPLQEDRPPFFKSWTGWYIFMLAYLAVLVTLFYIFTIYFE